MAVKNAKHIHHSQLTNTRKFAIFITEKVGTMGFFILIFLWTFIWLGWNMFAPEKLQFDPAPAFVLWLFISNMIQIFLMPLLLIGQNIQGKFAEVRAENDYEINVKAEQEINDLKNELAEIKNMLQAIQARVEQKQ